MWVWVGINAAEIAIDKIGNVSCGYVNIGNVYLGNSDTGNVHLGNELVKSTSEWPLWATGSRFLFLVNAPFLWNSLP